MSDQEFITTCVGTVLVSIGFVQMSLSKYFNPKTRFVYGLASGYAWMLIMMLVFDLNLQLVSMRPFMRAHLAVVVSLMAAVGSLRWPRMAVALKCMLAGLITICVDALVRNNLNPYSIALFPLALFAVGYAFHERKIFDLISSNVIGCACFWDGLTVLIAEKDEHTVHLLIIDFLIGGKVNLRASQVFLLKESIVFSIVCACFQQFFTPRSAPQPGGNDMV